MEDREMIVHKLRHPIEANSIRIRPWAFQELICIRFEFYGCDIPGSPGTIDRVRYIIVYFKNQNQTFDGQLARIAEEKRRDWD